MYQSSSLDFKLVQRVCLLQQALDQALDSLAELRDQVQDKQWIETQLANTEKYANTQQQAIAHLKKHLAQFTEIQHHLLSVIAYRLNELIDHQQLEFDRLCLQIQQGETELQTYLQFLQSHCRSDAAPPTSEDLYRPDLAAEVLCARAMVVSLSSQLSMAKQHVGNITATLQNHHLNLNQIIKTIRAMLEDLNTLDPSTDQPLPPLTCAGEMAAIAPPQEDTLGVQETLRRQKQRIQELETTLVKQFEQHTQMKQRYQVLAAERDHYRYQLEQAQAQIRDLHSLNGDCCPETEEASALPSWTIQSRLRSQPPPPIQPLKLQEDWNDID